MKTTLLGGLLLPLLIFANTYNTIVVDGNRGSWQTDEALGLSVGPDSKTYYGYLTWDANKLYFRVDTDILNTAVATQYDCEWVIFIDTDPQTNPLSGNGSSTPPVSYGGPPTLPFYADYGLEIFNQHGDGQALGRIWYYSNGAWNYSSFSGTGGNAEAYINANYNSNSNEAMIKRSYMNNPTQIYVVMYIADIISAHSVRGVWPTSNPNGHAPTLTHYYGFNNLGSGVTPGSASYVDNSLPVTLAAFSSRSLDGGIQLTWSTASEIENQGFIISRKELKSHQWEEIASFLEQEDLLGHGSTPRGFDYSYMDEKVTPGVTYSYLLSDVDYQGKRTDHADRIVTVTYSPTENQLSPATIKLVSTYPNPFNPTLNIQYDLSASSPVKFTIYDIKGHLVWSYVVEHLSAGKHILQWNGRDRQANPLPSGLYFLHYAAREEHGLRKITLLR